MISLFVGGVYKFRASLRFPRRSSKATPVQSVLEKARFNPRAIKMPPETLFMVRIHNGFFLSAMAMADENPANTKYHTVQINT